MLEAVPSTSGLQVEALVWEDPRKYKCGCVAVWPSLALFCRGLMSKKGEDGVYMCQCLYLLQIRRQCLGCTNLLC